MIKQTVERIRQRCNKTSRLEFFLIVLYLITTITTIFYFRCATIASVILGASLATFYAMSEDKYIGLMVIIVIGAIMVIYNSFGSQMSDRAWAFRWFDTLAGKSSCTRNPHVPLPYNKNGGLAYSKMEELYLAQSFCPHPDYRWGDNTGGEDNPGKGLLLGWSIIEWGDIGFCPGVVRELNSRGLIGKGGPIKTVCEYSFIQAGIISPHYSDYLSSGKWNPICKLCPGYIDSWEISCFRWFWGWLLFWVVICLGSTIKTTLCGGKQQID